MVRGLIQRGGNEPAVTADWRLTTAHRRSQSSVASQQSQTLEAFRPTRLER
jgi:hypothetical protein